MIASVEMSGYFEKLKSEVARLHGVASQARFKGFDPDKVVEVSLAENMAQRVVGLISVVAPQIVNSGVVERIIGLEKQYGSLDWRVALKIAEEIALEKFCKFESRQQAMEMGIRTGFAYVTVGVVSSPLDGIVNIEVKKRMDNRGEYICVNYAGPIRNAGGTAAAVSVIITDYVRKCLGFDVYDAQPDEIKRASIELQDYHERVTNLQYYPSESEVDFLLRNLPVEVSGDPSEKIEVSNFKDLPRVPTNKIRSGYCLMLSSCIPLKAPKLWKQLSVWGKDFNLDSWNFLDEFLRIQKKAKAGKQQEESHQKIAPDYTYIADLVAGRPVLGYPLRPGGFRLRYGRCRTSGFSAQAIHPAAMYILNQYIATGTQLKTERPGKAASVTACDSIDGPIVKLQDGSVIQIHTFDDAKRVHPFIKEILFLGDILVSYGDFFNRAHPLAPAGYCHEWWLQEVRRSLSEVPPISSAQEAVALARASRTPLHPAYTCYWNLLSCDEFRGLLDWFDHAKVHTTELGIQKIVLPAGSAKRCLELVGLPHLFVNNEFVVVERDFAVVLSAMFHLIDEKPSLLKRFISDGVSVLDVINQFSPFIVRDKAGTFIGTRMGRPEKAKQRELTGSPHVLFPVGEEGGRLRSFQSALSAGRVTADFPFFYCQKCNAETVLGVCEVCGSQTVQKWKCERCGLQDSNKCVAHGPNDAASERSVPIKHYFDSVLARLGIQQYPELIKGVRGTSNKEHIPENLGKGILRARYDVHVYKDGTTRYDMTQLPLTHFKPCEIGSSVERLKELGYVKDVYGFDLVNDAQILELKPQDVVLPSCSESPDDGADKVLANVSHFVDDALEFLYDLPRLYNVASAQDLIGQLVVVLAPHTSAGIVGRIIGFSRTQGLFAHPLLHAATRRDCFSYDTFIPIFDGNSWRNVKIGELVESLHPKRVVDSFGTKEIRVKNYKTLGLDKKGGVGVVKVNNFTKHAKSRLVKIVTRSGRSISTTFNHKFLVRDDEVVIKEAGDLKAGTILVLPKKIAFPQKKTAVINLLEVFQGRSDVVIRNVSTVLRKKIKNDLAGISKKTALGYDVLDNFYRRDSFPLNIFEKICSAYKIKPGLFLKSAKLASKRDTVLLPCCINFDEELMEYLGLYVAEGYSRYVKGKKGLAQVYVAGFDKEVRRRLLRFGEKLGLKNSENKQDRVTFSSRLWYELVSNFFKCGSTAYEKRVPSMLFEANKKLVSAFLRGYFEGDGSVSLSDIRVACDSVSLGLLQDIHLLLLRYGIFSRFYRYTKEPGPPLRSFYTRKGRKIPEFTITKLVIPSNYVSCFNEEVGFITERKKKILLYLAKKMPRRKIVQDDKFILDEIKNISHSGNQVTYCLNVDNHVVLANGILTRQCDGDEACVILLMDVFLNFSKKYLPPSRGSTMDTPLVLTSVLTPSEVDDMVFDMDVASQYPVELYEASLQFKAPWEVKVPQVKSRLNKPEQYEGMMFTHDISNLNQTVRCSAYKTLPSMEDKLKGQMDIAEKLRSVDASDVARLVIEKHFLKDIKGNLRKFSMQEFRCVACNEKFRRPPLVGKCTKCNGKIIFTVSEGSISKYLEPTISLAKKYNVSPYLQQTIELLKVRLESVFGKEPDKQVNLGAWFG